EEFLDHLLSLELEQRKNNRIQTLIRQSKIPQKVTGCSMVLETLLERG
ncbi:MAG: hypothetical protein RL705_1101, partial [Bacteroidota bacterium]